MKHLPENTHNHKPCSVLFKEERQPFICTKVPVRSFIWDVPVPLPHLGFPLAGFISFHLTGFPVSFVTVTP